MAITTKPISVTFSASNDGVAFTHPREIVGMTFQGSGLTAGQQMTVRNKSTVAAGSILADYLVAAAIDNADLWSGRKPQYVNGLSMDNTTIGGTWALTVFFGDFIE